MNSLFYYIITNKIIINLEKNLIAISEDRTYLSLAADKIVLKI